MTNNSGQFDDVRKVNLNVLKKQFFSFCYRDVKEELMSRMRMSPEVLPS